MVAPVNEKARWATFLFLEDWKCIAMFERRQFIYLMCGGDYSTPLYTITFGMPRFFFVRSFKEAL